MSLETSTQAIRQRIGDDSGLDATVKVDFGDDGAIFVDATKTPNVVNNDNGAAQCTIGISLADFESMLAGELSATSAFMSGQLRIDGDMGVAMKIQSLFS